MKAGIEITEGVALGGYSRHLRLANAHIELVVATEFGPRIVAYGPRGGPNMFAILPPDAHASPSVWRSYGGHRLWAAPEDPRRTYAPDNAPVQWRATEDGVVVTGNLEPESGLVKELTIALDPSSCRVRVTHRLTNRGAPAELAPWALSVMAPSGVAIVPNAPFVPHPEALLPARPLVLWPYTWLGDPRFAFGRRFMRMRQDPVCSEPQKIGVFNAEGWAGYAKGTSLFVKHFASHAATYPDMGCNFEAFTDATILELESLGPLVRLARDAFVEHVETWTAFSDVLLPDDDEEAARLLAPLVALGRNAVS